MTYSKLLPTVCGNFQYLFDLQERVRVSEIWLHRHPESETGFLVGWPSPARTYLVSFCTQAARDSWWRELKQALSAQLRLEPPTTNIKVVFKDPQSGTECSKTVGVLPETSSGEVGFYRYSCFVSVVLFIFSICSYVKCEQY